MKQKIITKIFGSVDDEEISALIQKMYDEDPRERQEAAITLGKLGRAVRANDAVLLVLRCNLRFDKHALVRQSAAVALGRLGKVGDAEMNALTQGLCDKDAEVRKAVTMALGKLGKAGSLGVILTYNKNLYNDNPSIRREATVALNELGHYPEDTAELRAVGRYVDIGQKQLKTQPELREWTPRLFSSALPTPSYDNQDEQESTCYYRCMIM